MTDEEKIRLYREAVRACHTAALLIAQHDLPGVLRAIAHADAFGPLLDPTAWRDKHEAMHQDREVVNAAMGLFEFGRKLHPEMARFAELGEPNA